MAYALTSREGAAVRIEAPEVELEVIEIRLLLEGIRLCYGYDFREYAMRPVRRSIIDAMAAEGVRTVSAYQDRILHDASCMRRFLGSVGVSVTSMFRHPELMRRLREEVVPVLRTYPSARIWMVGCATGEEVYSLAILLEEEGILRRTSIYATDLNEDTLAVARIGAYPLDRVRSYENGYLSSGGRGKLSDHYSVSGRSARFHRNLQTNITWARHNLVTDASFNEFHLIICANVLIYFRPTLQERAHRLFFESLVPSGFLAMGKGESLIFSPESSRYQRVGDSVSLFRKVR
jgi:chemotaxis protein methyltransferase CheR